MEMSNTFSKMGLKRILCQNIYKVLINVITGNLLKAEKSSGVNNCKALEVHKI